MRLCALGLFLDVQLVGPLLSPRLQGGECLEQSLLHIRQ